ncbi:MAG: 1-acyl-sn-glycerol-3-phosphate acyltransferase [Lachnospiraceae bacterium]|nr:1-acyl-sn-glycerol-3-phosphate acyltransferase [Lachnospiraceae bacterium]MBR3636766.1 1-acyl-sn-glycerol-3-phosphate acyltransferase [Lachnospiraceae bacterium]
MVYILMAMGVLTAIGVAIPCHLYTQWYHIPAFLGMCVGFFIIWAALYLLFALILGAICNIKKVEYDPDPVFQWIATETMKYILFFTNTSVKVEGIEKIPKDEKCLVVSNHLSNYDPISIMTHIPLKPLIFISKPENFNLPVAGGIVRKAGFMAIDRDQVKNAIVTINKAADKIKNDQTSVFIFPEGTRNRTEEKLLEFKNGAFKIATKAKCPLVVLAVKNTNLVKKRTPWRHTTVSLKVVDVIPAERVAKMKTAELSDEVREKILEAL